MLRSIGVEGSESGSKDSWVGNVLPDLDGRSLGSGEVARGGVSGGAEELGGKAGHVLIDEGAGGQEDGLGHGGESSL